MVDKYFSAFNRIIKKYHLHAFKDVTLFVLILLFFHFVYRAFAVNISALNFIRTSSNWLALQVYRESCFVVNLFTSKVTFFDQLHIQDSLRHNVFYYALNNGYVAVNSSCSGLKQFYQWFFLMTLFPGPWKHKLWFIPMGIIVTHLVNVFRIVSMVFVTVYISEYWSFIHDWVLRPFFYVVMFMLWVWWNEKYHLPYRKKRKAIKSASGSV